jgi:hypothetical protein
VSDGDELPADADVLRIPAVTLTHVPAGERVQTPAAFALSPAERAARGERVRVSVWDGRKIAPADALAQRAGGGPCAVFALRVEAVTRLAVEIHHPALRVVEDPGGAPVGAAPAIVAAHAGIEGLDAGPTRTLKDARARLAEACRQVEP